MKHLFRPLTQTGKAVIVILALAFELLVGAAIGRLL